MVHQLQKAGLVCLIIILLIVVLKFLIPVSIISGIFAPVMSYEEAEEYFEKHSSELSLVIHYMNEFQDEDVFCSKEDGYGMVYSTKARTWTEIEDEAVCQAIRLLFCDKCTDISKANETVSFTLFSKNMNVGGGIVYDISGELNTKFINSEFVTESKSLSASGWYYYYSDFEKWRSEGRSTLLGGGNQIYIPEVKAEWFGQ